MKKLFLLSLMLVFTNAFYAQTSNEKKQGEVVFGNKVIKKGTTTQTKSGEVVFGNKVIKKGTTRQVVVNPPFPVIVKEQSDDENERPKKRRKFNNASDRGRERSEHGRERSEENKKHGKKHKHDDDDDKNEKHDH